MFVFALQSLTTLSLAGVAVCAIFTSKHLQGQQRMRQALLGLAFGIAVISLGMHPISTDPNGVALEAQSGPLMFAGYLGGPIGALIAGLCGAGHAVLLGGPSLGIRLFMSLAIPAMGVAVRVRCPPHNGPTIPTWTTRCLLLGFIVLRTVPLGHQATAGTQPGTLASATSAVAGMAALGILSILFTSQVLRVALRSARGVTEASELAKKLKFLRHVSGIGMFEHRRGEDALFFDEEMMSLFGLHRAPGMVALSEWVTRIHPDDLPRVEDTVAKIWAGVGVTPQLDFRAVRPDGTIRYVRSNWITDRDAQGTVVCVSGMYTDLTDFREVEQRYRGSRDRLSVLTENLPGVIFEMDSTDRHNPELLYISPKCEALWGYTGEELRADPTLFAKVHDPADTPAFLNALERGLETGEPVYHRYGITARDGQFRWLDFHGHVSSEHGQVRISAIVLDASREVEVQKQVEYEREISRRAQRIESIGQLTGGVAHDFNNLLAVILGNLELLRDDDDDPAMRAELIDTAVTAALRGADLTRNMLAFARQAPLKPVTLDLNNVVREAKNWIGRALPESVVVETSLLGGLWPVEADRSSLESALLNLLLNGRDAMEGHGNMTIETANVRLDKTYIDERQEDLAPGRYVMLAVSDTGSGISDEHMSSIFEPFFTTKPPGVGSGLGLSMTVGFMKQSGGTVRVYSEVGTGTTFKLYFPAATGEGELPSKPSVGDKGTAGGGLRLLVAEDEDAVRNTLLLMLQRAGYHVTATTSGDAAFAAFEADPTFDILLTDIVMPGKLQGTSLARALRERWPDLPVLFMSGYASEATVHGNGLRPEDIRLMKPVQRAELLAAVATVAAQLKG